MLLCACDKGWPPRAQVSVLTQVMPLIEGYCTSELQIPGEKFDWASIGQLSNSGQANHSQRNEVILYRCSHQAQALRVLGEDSFSEKRDMSGWVPTRHLPHLSAEMPNSVSLRSASLAFTSGGGGGCYCCFCLTLSSPTNV